jgi:hypothetical protein
LNTEYYQYLFNKDNPQILIKPEFLYSDFLRNVVIEVDFLIKRHGIIGYLEGWNAPDFTLKRILLQKEAGSLN